MSEACAAKAYRPRGHRSTPQYRLWSDSTRRSRASGRSASRGGTGAGTAWSTSRCNAAWTADFSRWLRTYPLSALSRRAPARLFLQTRDLCPSCAVQRGAETAALLVDEVLEDVGHALWVFVFPKMLRRYFLHHRELLGGLARAAWETVFELMVAAADEEDLRPGMVSVVQTAGDLANWHPHVHALVSRAGWTQCGRWVPIPYVDETAAELLFRHKVIRPLQEEALLSDERTQLLKRARFTHLHILSRIRPGGGEFRDHRGCLSRAGSITSTTG